MKKIKIGFSGFYNPNFDYTKSYIYQVLAKHYEVEVCDKPDYIICSCFGKPYEYCKYPQVRIMLLIENYTPDFNFIDYAISSYPINFLDRHFYFPGCVNPIEHSLSLEKKRRHYDENFLKEKEYFASFVASHESEYNIRGDFFKKLCKYKKVQSVGNYLNNTGISVDYKDDSKTSFQRKCKFSLCFESTKNEGFLTEKITDAFYSDTIPVYYGSDTVLDFFNPDAFINVSSFKTMDEAIERIKEIDQNDELYLKMMNAPILKDEHVFSKILAAYEDYLVHIFEQPLEKAYRRSRCYAPADLEKYLLSAAQIKPLEKPLSQYPIRELTNEIFARAKRKIKKN